MTKLLGRLKLLLLLLLLIVATLCLCYMLADAIEISALCVLHTSILFFASAFVEACQRPMSRIMLSLKPVCQHRMQCRQKYMFLVLHFRMLLSAPDVAVMQAIGIMPNAASAEALLQSCRDCQHLSHKVNSMTAPFQAVLAAAQLMPRTAALQGMATTSTADVPETLPSADIMHRWQASPTGSYNMAASPSAQVNQSSGAGLRATAPPPGQLVGALHLGPLAALPSSGLADETGHLASGPKSGPMAAGSGSGPPTGAPPTPDLHSEGSDVSPSHAEEASAHQL